MLKVSNTEGGVVAYLGELAEHTLLLAHPLVATVNFSEIIWNSSK